MWIVDLNWSDQLCIIISIERYSRCYISACPSFFVFLTVSVSSVHIFKWKHKGSCTQVWLLTETSCTFCFSFSVFLFLQIHNWKFSLLSCQFLALCASCMLFLSLLRQMEHCLQCMRRFALVLYLNWISALFYFFPLMPQIENRTLNMVSHCVCVWMHTLVSPSHSIWKGDRLKKIKIYESVKHLTILNRNIPPTLH